MQHASTRQVLGSTMVEVAPLAFPMTPLGRAQVGRLMVAMGPEAAKVLRAGLAVACGSRMDVAARALEEVAGFLSAGTPDEQEAAEALLSIVGAVRDARSGVLAAGGVA